MERLTIIKVGGKVVEEPELLNRLLDQFIKVSGKKILVHGGGTIATDIAGKMGIKTEMVGGRRITSSEMLKVVAMVYGGLINKQIVAGLQAKGENTLGITGADLNLILSKKRPVDKIDFGFVGDVIKVNSDELRKFISNGITPIIAPITHDGKGQLLNTNADTIAAELAIELANYYSVNIYYCFEKIGVLYDIDDPDSLIKQLNHDQFIKYQKEGIIQSGMIPKLENGFRAIENGVKKVLITNFKNFAYGRGTDLI